MAAQAQMARFYPAITSSQILVKAGESKLPYDKINGIESIVQSVGALYGWTIAESTGTAKAKVRLWDGTSNSGYYISTITLEANESTRDFFPVQALELFNNALYLEVVSGSVEGIAFYG